MVLHNIAAIQYRIGALDSAEFYAAKVLKIDSLNVPSTHLMARILNASGRWEEAQRLIMRVTPNSAGMEDQLNETRAKMDSLTELGLWKEALMAYGEYGKLGFDIHPDDRLRIGRLQLEIGNFDQALQLFSSAEAAEINLAGLYFHKGRTLVGLSLPNDAIAAIQKCLSMEPDHIEARIFLARLYINKGKIDDAWSELEAVSHLEIIKKELAEEYNSLIDSLKAL
ncbi:tetratricopeptide repeat protein [bacterium]|nr:tetratricopeptide repeat protein [bacterium]